MAQAGYSGTPLFKKLEFKPGFRVWVIDPPSNYLSLLSNAIDVEFVDMRAQALDAIHLFARAQADLNKVQDVLGALTTGGRLWISWAKKSSPLHNNVTEDHLRQAVLPLGWVDTKVCAVDQDWSGLKFLKRKMK